LGSYLGEVPDPQIGGKHLWELAITGDKFHQLPNSGDIYMQDVNGANWIVKINGQNMNVPVPLNGPLPPYIGPFQPPAPYVNFKKFISLKKQFILILKNKSISQGIHSPKEGPYLM
jgi:hypothetical protein